MRARKRKTSSDAPCPGIAEAFASDTCPDRSRAMIGGVAFLLVKTGSNGPESSEQAEIPLAGSATILAFGFPQGLGSVARKPRRPENCITVESMTNSTDYG
jgi:hypothetical protein